MAYGIVVYSIAQTVVEVVHQPAFFYGVDLVESTCDMESACVHIVEGLARAHLILGEPFLVGITEVELVAVFILLHAAHDGMELDARIFVFTAWFG